METGRAQVGSRLRTAALAGTILTLTAVTFDTNALQPIAAAGRYPLAALLLTVTLHQGATSRRPLASAPRTARTLIGAAWVFATISMVLAPFSIAPTEALAQTAILVLMVATMHTHVTRRWHHPGTVVRDMHTIVWTLGTPVVASLALGRLHEPRLSGLFNNPNTLAIAAAMVCALGIGLTAHTRRPTYLILTVVSAVALLRTESRTTFIALILAAAILALRRASRRIPPSVVIAGCFTASAALLAYMVMGRLPIPTVVARFGMRSATGPLNNRDLAWEYAIELWSRRPATGYGFRVGETAFQQNRGLTLFTRDGVHNSYLQTLLEAGILGSLPFAAMLLAAITVVWRLKPTGINMGLVALVIVGLTSAVGESFLFGLGQMMSWVFWLAAAAAAAMTEDAPRSRSAPEENAVNSLSRV